VPGIRQGATHFSHSLIKAFRYPLVAMMRVVLRNPSLSYRINQRLLRYPALHQQLLGVARGQGGMPGVSTYVPPCPPSTMAETEVPGHLTPHARQIYHDLKAAIESRQKENG
jgi:O-antigen chain-terminating methyltransferase